MRLASCCCWGTDYILGREDIYSSNKTCIQTSVCKPGAQAMWWGHRNINSCLMASCLLLDQCPAWLSHSEHRARAKDRALDHWSGEALGSPWTTWLTAQLCDWVARHHSLFLICMSLLWGEGIPYSVPYNCVGLSFRGWMMPQAIAAVERQLYNCGFQSWFWYQ